MGSVNELELVAVLTALDKLKYYKTLSYIDRQVANLPPRLRNKVREYHNNCSLCEVWCTYPTDGGNCSGCPLTCPTCASVLNTDLDYNIELLEKYLD